jgi:hypothetical protein
MKSLGISLMIFISSNKLPEASLIATIFWKSFAKRTTVSAVIDTPVRPGTLYKIIGRGLSLAIAAKCAYKPFCDGLL